LVVKTLDGSVIPNPVFSALPRPENDGRPVLLSCLRGGGHFRLCSSEHTEPFDIVHPRAQWCVPGERRRISGQAVTESIKCNERLVAVVLGQFKQIGYRNIIHFQAPPPPESLPPSFSDRVRKMGGVPSNPLHILKAWYCQDDANRDLCAEAGVTYFRIPPEALTVDGFLRAEYCSPDGMHGNAEFGRMMLLAALKEIPAA